MRVNTGQAQRKRRWGGVGGKGFKYDSTEKSQQQKDRARAKKDLLIGENEADEEEELKDPWLDDKPMSKMSQEKQPHQPQQQVQSGSSDPMATAVGAAQIAARLQADAARQPHTQTNLTLPSHTSSVSNAFTSTSGISSSASLVLGKSSAPAAVLPELATPNLPSTCGSLVAVQPPSVANGKASAVAKNTSRKSEQEIEKLALNMAEKTLKNAPDEIREKQLVALALKLGEKLRNLEEEQAAMPRPKMPPPPPTSAEQRSPVLMALPLVPGVFGIAEAAQPTMVSKSMEQLQANLVRPVAGTAHLAEAQAVLMTAMGPAAPAGMTIEEVEINDYPQIARQKISHKEPLLSI